MKLVARKLKPVLDHRVKKTRWCVLRWPSPSMAQQAGMSTERFEKFFFDVCTLDYSRMQPGMKALKALMERTDQVRINGPGNGPCFLDQGHPRRCLRRHAQYPGRRSVYLPGEEFSPGVRDLQCAHHLPGDGVR